MIEKVRTIIDKHAPLKSKKVRGNNKPFITKELRSAIMRRSRLRTKYNKWKSIENFIAYRAAKREYDILTENAKTQYFAKATEKGFMNNKEFWKVMKPALTNKGVVSLNVIILEEKGEMISDESKLVEIFNPTHHGYLKPVLSRGGGRFVPFSRKKFCTGKFEDKPY